MSLLASAAYDPATAAGPSTASLLAMTAIDTTNLRLTFTAPASGNVLVRLRCVVEGATTFPQILLGVLDGSTVRLRQVPIGSLKTTALATSQLTQEALGVVSGLTPGNSYTWDAAYGVEVVVASTLIKFGGPNDTTTNNAWGDFVFEVWDAPTLLDNASYDPAVAVSKATSALLAMTALDTTNLRATFTAPPSGNVFVRLRGSVEGATTMPGILLGILNGASVVFRQSPIGGILGTAVATTRICHEASGVITGLTPGNTYNLDAAYGVEIILASTNLKYGGPNDTTTDNAWGAFTFEVYSA